MSETNGQANADSVALKQRLAGLSAGQRAQLLRRLGETGASATSSSALIPKAKPLRVEANPQVTVYPAAHGQQRMWFLHHYAPESPVYCCPTAFRLAGPLNVAVLEAAFRAVIQRHDILRTTFTMENGELFQRVAATSAFQLQPINLEAIPAATRQTAAERRLQEEACRPFDLAAGPAVRAVLVRLQPDEHVLLLVLHHIISDGWSRSNFFRELSATYQALVSGRSPNLRDLPVQFADYSAWQQGWLEGGALEAQTAYWKNKLAGELEPLELPCDRARPATESFRGGGCTQRLNPELLAKLKSRAQEEGATLFMILLAAFKTLLHRYTGQDDLIVGVPIANRPRVEAEGLIGFFVNTLVMRTGFAGDPTFRELLRRVKATAVEAYEHQAMPFERLVERLQVRRDASRTPLFQATFALQDFPEVALPLPEISSAPWPVGTQTAKFDFSLTLERSAEGWTVVAEYSTDLFDAGRVERMLQHWNVILESVAANPDQCVSELPLLTAAERQLILGQWNRTERDYPRDKCVHQLVEEQAERTPDAVAVDFENHTLSYRELNARANQLALHLRSLGVGPDVLVGLCVERSLEMVLALLGILKAGGAYVPLDPHFPPERLAFMIEDAAMPVLLTERRVADRLPAQVAQVVWLDEFRWRSGAENLSLSAAADSLVYVIYTSGSTGRPNGVEISNRALVNCLYHFRDQLRIGPKDVWLAITTLSFDIAALEIWLPLLAGARCIVATRETALNGRRLGRALLDRGVTCLQATPMTWKLLLQSGWPGNPRLRILCGGEALAQDLADSLAELGSEAWNLYGPTETTIWSAAKKLRRHEPVNIGGPLANTQIYLLDGRRQPVATGVPGDLYIGGDGLARSYRNRPGLTSARFVPNPFEPGARIYKTGDRGRWLPDGSVEFLGRMDDQVKLRGYRIELGEIETALRAMSEVREAAVIVREDAPGDHRLVAYLIAAGAEKPDVSRLRAPLAETLPDYMLPNVFIWLEQLPLTPNGKVNRQALPALATMVASTTPARKDPPRDALEHELMRLWQELFHRDDLGRDDHFFELGGHSLLAIRLITEIEKMAGRTVPIAVLFQAPTVATLAHKLRHNNFSTPQSSLVTLQSKGSEPPVFCIHGMFGEVYAFLPLARALAPERPVYGLQAVGLDGRQPRHATVEQLAAHYAAEIRSLRPEGPYHLVGASLGGWFAYAVAQELTRLGGRVALLALLDTRSSVRVSWPLHFWVTTPVLAARAKFHFKRWFSGPDTGRLLYLKQKLSWFWLHLTRTRGRLPYHPVGASASASPAHTFTVDYFEALGSRYQPEPYAGDVVVFVGQDEKVFNHDVFWKHFIRGRMQKYSVTGGHISMINEAHATRFAEVFKRVLHEADAAAGRVWPASTK